MSSPREEPQPVTEPLVPDDDIANTDDDSALNLSVTSSSESITSSILHYRQENGRTYHAYKEGKYVFPNDDIESDRLDLQHHVFTLTFDGKLYTCPAGKDKILHRVLDVGTGTGIWALDFADEHPESQVIGVDLSPIQPAFVPPNLSYYVDDLEEPWTFSSKFDFIYTRMLTGSFGDWPKFFQRAYNHLNPGGWIELCDIVFPVQSDDGTLPADSAVTKWSNHIIDAATILQKTANSAKEYKTQLEAVGFKNVTQVKYRWPMNAWPKEKKYKELGMWTEHNIGGGLSGISLALFTRGLGWDTQELEVFLAAVRKEIKNKQIHAYWPIYVVYGQKPE